jgi:hypothetical protein
MTVGGLFGEKSCIQAIGMLLMDFTSRAPTAISATSSLDVHPVSFNAARDLVTPARLISGLAPYARSSQVHQLVKSLQGDVLSDSEVLHVFTVNSGLIAAVNLGVRPIQLLVRLPHSHIDPNWLSAAERESRNQPRESRRGSKPHS